MKLIGSKIALFILLIGVLQSCNTVKRVTNKDYLLTKNTIYVNNKETKQETIKNLIYQQPNNKIPLIDIPLRLHVYNLARPNIDSIVNQKIKKDSLKGNQKQKFLSKKQYDKFMQSKVNFNKWLKNIGEPPTILDSTKTAKSIKRIESYYFNNGWFNVKAKAETKKSEDKKAAVTYTIKTGKPFILYTITTDIKSKIIDSLYNLNTNKSILKANEQYKTVYFENERKRISNNMRNSGVYHFNQNYIQFEMDTIDTNNKVNVDLKIQKQAIRTQDSIIRKDFDIFKIKDVNIYTDLTFENRNKTITDSITYKDYNLYSINDMRFRAKALTDAIFITPNTLFKDIDRINTYKHLSGLRNFKYPSIEYIENQDTTLTTNIYLSPLKKFSLGFSAEASQSNIQTIGISLNPSLKIRNVFRGAEILDISGFGSIGASKDRANNEDKFFDINEIGVDFRLTIPRLFFPFNTEKIIPKTMFPNTRISMSVTSQTNIGLDKQTLNSFLNYQWLPNASVTNKLDLFNIQYVRNLNTSNYFGVYTNSYNTLNNIAQTINYNNGENLNFPTQTNAFINDVISGNTSIETNSTNYQTVSAIRERKNRLTEDNLIISTNFNYVKDKRENLIDQSFSIFRFKAEVAGNLLSLSSNLLGLKKNNNDRFELFNVAYSQYVKTELDYIKHWSLGGKNVLAIRSYFGIAIPYGNSTNIPFAKSFFAGGANDNRAWTPYNLGPGSSQSNNEFNEANLKLAFSVENRFNLFGNLYGALFIDTGNIWNALNDVEDEQERFTSFNSLNNIAIGSGFGLRYDFNFFVFRFDIGFKTYNPSYIEGERWFKDYNFNNAVYNIGINYPF